MMSSCEVAEIRSAGNEIHDGLSVSATKFSRVESDGVNLQCVNSSDFMVGKQTNFNGPVTIINYGDGNEPEDMERKGAKTEEVIIKEKIMATGVASSMKNFVQKKVEEELKQFQNGKDGGDHRSPVRRVCMRNFLRVPVFVWVLIAFVVFAGCITLVIELTVGEDDVPEDAITFPWENQSYTIFSRKHWRAAAERSSVGLKLPVLYVVISSTNTKPCAGLKECGRVLREHQSSQARKSQSDIYANFLVSGDGYVYEGRGWYKRNAFLGFANSRSIEISFVGEFAGPEEPTSHQTNAAKAFIAYGLREKMFCDNYKLIPANATGVTLVEEDPTIGHNLYAAIRNWTRFTPDPYSELYHGPSGEPELVPTCKR